MAMLLLHALLLVAGLSAAAAATAGSGNDAGVIRLPSDDTVSGFVAERPWKCCDMQPCTKSWPALCWCKDQLEQCSSACKECAKVTGSNPPRYTCNDKYKGSPAPMCSTGGQKTVQAGSDDEEMTVVRGSTAREGNGGNNRPWKCCDKAVMGPTTEGKVVWYCMDKVKKCTCDRCYELNGGSQRYYYCLDGYHGSDPGPSCTRA